MIQLSFQSQTVHRYVNLRITRNKILMCTSDLLYTPLPCSLLQICICVFGELAHLNGFELRNQSLNHIERNKILHLHVYVKHMLSHIMKKGNSLYCLQVHLNNKVHCTKISVSVWVEIFINKMRLNCKFCRYLLTCRI